MLPRRPAGAAASDSDAVATIAATFQILTLLLVSADVVAAAKAAGCVQACLAGYKRCARTAALQTQFCTVRRGVCVLA